MKNKFFLHKFQCRTDSSCPIDKLIRLPIMNFFQYFIGGRELPDDIRQKVQTDGSLVINPVQKSADSGVYTCWARNKQGHSARRSGEVTVIGKRQRQRFK